MKLSLGFSPCPNDTFIFDALVHQKIDTEGLSFEVQLADVEALNAMAFDKKLDITKLSYHAYGYLVDDYALLDSGSALGNNCGPLLISKEIYKKSQVDDLKIAIPGKYTTANFLLGLAFPNAVNKEAIIFSDIEKQVLNETYDAGLIIHENRFTYHERGLHKIIDLGEFWESSTGLPIPLGGIVVDRRLPKEIQQKVERVLKRSVEFAKQKPEETTEYVSQHAQEMEADIMYKHIDLYVNDFTISLGEEGRKAVSFLLEKGKTLGLIPDFKEDIFV